MEVGQQAIMQFTRLPWNRETVNYTVTLKIKRRKILFGFTFEYFIRK